jgi:phospholipase/lecithinase/hemolysin
VDMKPVFEASQAPLKYYFNSDPHWTAEGHALAARELESLLLTQPDK